MDWTLGSRRAAGQRHRPSVAFYRDKLGFDLDHDTRNEHMHVVQLTPPGSGCSIVIGDLPSQTEMAPGSMRGLQLVVADAAVGSSGTHRPRGRRQRDHRFRRAGRRNLLRLHRPRWQQLGRTADQGPSGETADPGRGPATVRRGLPVRAARLPGLRPATRLAASHRDGPGHHHQLRGVRSLDPDTVGSRGESGQAVQPVGAVHHSDHGRRR